MRYGDYDKFIALGWKISVFHDSVGYEIVFTKGLITASFNNEKKAEKFIEQAIREEECQNEENEEKEES